MDQNVNEIKWALTNPIKFMDKECGEVEVVAKGVFSYQVTNQETFSAAATQANMDGETYAKGLLLRLVVDEINKYSGKMALGLSGFVKNDSILLNGNSKVAALGLTFTSVNVESIDLTEESKNKMKDIETSKIKAAITGRDIVNNNVFVENENIADENVSATGENIVTETTGDKPAEKNNGVFSILIAAIIVAVLMMIFFR